MPAPVVGAGHGGHGAAGDEDEVLGVEVLTETAGFDGAPHDAFGDRREVGLLGGDVGPPRLPGTEERVSEPGVCLGGLQIAVEEGFERGPGVVTTPTGQIGSQLVRRLLGQNQTVRVIVRDASRLDSSVRDQVQTVIGSHDEPAVLDRALPGAEALF